MKLTLPYWRWTRLIAVAVTMSLTVIGCTGSTSDQQLAYTAEQSELPTPSGAVVLTIEGAGLDNVELDLAGIESIGTTTVVVHDPFVNEQLNVTGVEIDRLLGAAGVSPEAPLVWTALDNYTVLFNRQSAGDDRAILATRIDDQPINVADGGPIRIVFLEADGPLARDSNQWIWSLSTITVG